MTDTVGDNGAPDAAPVPSFAQVAIYKVDPDTRETLDELAPLYDAPNGNGRLSNPLTLDAEGKAATPIYVDTPVTAQVNSAAVGSHGTGVFEPKSGSWRGDWTNADGTVYLPGDMVRDGAAGADTGNLYIARRRHAPSTWAADLGASYWDLGVDVQVLETAAAEAATEAAEAVLSSKLATNGDGSSVSVTPAGGSASATLAALFGRVVTPEDFGAVGDGVADDRAAVAGCLAYAVTYRRRVAFRPGATYRLDYSGTTATLCDLTGAVGVRIEGNGATLHFDRAWADTDSVIAFRLDGTANFRCSGLNFTMTEQPYDETTTRGIYAFALYGATRNVKIENIVQTGGIAGVFCFRTAGVEPVTDRVAGLVVLNYKTLSVGYGLTLAHSGDNVFVRGLETDKSFRSFFAYGVTGWDVQYAARNQRSQSILAAYNQPTRGIADAPYLRNGRLHITVLPATVSRTTAAHLVMVAKGPAPVEFSDIQIGMHIENDTTNREGVAFEVQKQTWNGAADVTDTTTGRGHVFRNIRLSGITIKEPNAAGLIGLWQGSAWSGETVYGFVMEDVDISGSLVGGCTLEGYTAIHRSGPVFRNVNFPGGNNLTGGYVDYATFENCLLGSTYYGLLQIGNRARTVQLARTSSAGLPVILEGAASGSNYAVRLDARNASVAVGALDFTADGQIVLRPSAALTQALAVTDTRVDALLPLRLPSYTVGTLPSAATHARSLAWCSNEAGGPTVVRSDGTNWRRDYDNAIAT